jgi:hypothetical protein
VIGFFSNFARRKNNVMKKLSVDFKDKKSILRLLYNVALYGFTFHKRFDEIQRNW